MAERKKTPRVVLMEARVDAAALEADVPAEAVDDEGRARVYVEVGLASGGPREVIKAAAKVPGVYLAPPGEGFRFRKRMARPPEDRLVMEDVEDDEG